MRWALNRVVVSGYIFAFLTATVLDTWGLLFPSDDAEWAQCPKSQAPGLAVVIALQLIWALGAAWYVIGVRAGFRQDVVQRTCTAMLTSAPSDEEFEAKWLDSLRLAGVVLTVIAVPVLAAGVCADMRHSSAWWECLAWAVVTFITYGTQFCVRMHFYH